MSDKRKVKVKLSLSDTDSNQVSLMLRKGAYSVRVIKRAMVLNLFDNGKASPEIAKAVGVTPETARRIAQNYISEGLDRALFDKQRPGHKRTFSDKERNEIIALVCSDPPDGFQRWTVRLLAEEAVNRKIVKSIGRETIRVILQDHEFKPWRKKNVVRSIAK
jgi:putative transposase